MLSKVAWCLSSMVEAPYSLMRLKLTNLPLGHYHHHVSHAGEAGNTVQASKGKYSILEKWWQEEAIGGLKSKYSLANPPG